jgi:hypothetical protein
MLLPTNSQAAVAARPYAGWTGRGRSKPSRAWIGEPGSSHAGRESLHGEWQGALAGGSTAAYRSGTGLRSGEHNVCET